MNTINIGFINNKHWQVLNENRKFGHTLWIDPNGNVIDISGKSYTHFDWLINKLKPEDKNDIYALASSGGWVQVRNHSYAFGPSISFTGKMEAFKRNKKIIMEIIDQTLFDPKVNKFWAEFNPEDDNGDYVGERIIFKMPEQDGKLARFL